MNPTRALPPLVCSLLGCAACAPAPSAPAAAATSSPIAAARPAHPTPSPALLVLAKRDETLAIVDPSTLAVVARVPVGHDPHEVVASPDAALAYVSNYGHGELHTLAVVDLAAQTARPAIDLGALHGPHGLAYEGGKVWFTAEGAKVVGSYDPAKAGVDWVLGTGQDRTHMLLVSRDMKSIVTSNVSSGTLSFLEKTAAHGPPPPPPGGGPGAPPGPPGGGPRPPGPPPGSDWEQTLVPVGAGTEGLDISPDGREIWAADAQDGAVVVVDAANKKVRQRIEANIQGANRLKFSPDGQWVLVSTLRGPDVVVFDAATRKESRRIPVGRGASGILMQPDGARAYVACSPDGYVAVVDLRTMTVLGKIQAGAEPDGMAWATAKSGAR